MSASKQSRLYELDWLRTAAIVLVVWYHTGMFFNSWGFHINTPDPVTSLEPIMVWMSKWRMPLLLFISGIGTAFMLKRRSLLRFVWERHNRLAIPLFFGMLFIVPPQVYVEKIDSYSSYLNFWPSILNLQAYPEGNFSWHHLWFICYLFFYSLVALPLFAFCRSPRTAAFRNKLAQLASKPAAFSIWLVPMLVSEFLLRPHFMENTHALTDDWAGFMHYFLFFVGGYISMTLPGIWDAIKRDRWIYTILALASTVLLELTFFDQVPALRLRGLNFTWIILTLTTGWFSLLALVGWAQVHLRRKSKRLARWNEASYPVYILHQTILLVAAYPLIDSQLHWSLQFTYLFAISLLGSLFLYQLVIKRFNLLRLVFGLKPKPHTSKQANTYARPLPQKASSLAEH